MINIIIKNKSFIKGPTPYRRRKPSGAGFVLLFAVTISAILLAISLGVANIALKEVKFGTSAKDTNEAFFAADTGLESVLLADKPPSSQFVLTPSDPEPKTWPLIYVNGLGSAQASCAIVSVTKQRTPAKTTIISKGYNIGTGATCLSTNPDRIERQLELTY